MRLLHVFAWVLAGLLAGCATPTPKVNLQAGTLKAGQTVALVESPEVVQYFIWAPHPGMAFGAIGGLVAGADFAQRADKVKQAMAAERLVPHKELTEVYRREFERAGYRVVVVNAWKREGNTLVADLKQVGPEYDRVLVLTPALFGFMTDGVTGNYRPTMRVRAALYGPDRTRLLYDGYHVTGTQPKGDGWIYASSIETSFTSWDLMVSQPRAMAESLRQAMGLVAKSTLRDLGAPAGPSRAAPVAPAGAASAQAATVAGQWTGSLQCGPYLGAAQVDNPGPWRARVAMTVESGVVTLTRGDSNYSETLQGELGSDLRFAASGSGATFARPNLPWTTSAEGRIDAAARPPRVHGTATVHDPKGILVRDCAIELVKSAAAS